MVHVFSFVMNTLKNPLKNLFAGFKFDLPAALPRIGFTVGIKYFAIKVQEVGN